MAKHSAKDAASILNLDVSRVKQLCRGGRLGTKCGHYWVITDEQIAAFRAAGPGKPGPKPK